MARAKAGGREAGRRLGLPKLVALGTDLCLCFPSVKWIDLALGGGLTSVGGSVWCHAQEFGRSKGALWGRVELSFERIFQALRD